MESARSAPAGAGCVIPNAGQISASEGEGGNGQPRTHTSNTSTLMGMARPIPPDPAPAQPPAPHPRPRAHHRSQPTRDGGAASMPPAPPAGRPRRRSRRRPRHRDARAGARLAAGVEPAALARLASPVGPSSQAAGAASRERARREKKPLPPAVRPKPNVPVAPTPVPSGVPPAITASGVVTTPPRRDRQSPPPPTRRRPGQPRLSLGPPARARRSRHHAGGPGELRSLFTELAGHHMASCATS